MGSSYMFSYISYMFYYQREAANYLCSKVLNARHKVKVRADVFVSSLIIYDRHDIFKKGKTALS